MSIIWALLVEHANFAQNFFKPGMRLLGMLHQTLINFDLNKSKEKKGVWGVISRRVRPIAAPAPAHLECPVGVFVEAGKEHIE